MRTGRFASVAADVRSLWLRFAAVLLVTTALAPILVTGPFYLNIGVLICAYVVLAQAWNLLAGFAGQVSLGQHLFFGVGAYGSTLLFIHLGMTPWVGIPIAAIAAVLLGLAIGWPTFQLKAYYFSIATLLIGAIAAELMVNAYWAGGAAGIYIPFQRGSWVTFQFGSKATYFYVVWVLAVLSTLVVVQISRTRPGYYLRAIRDDPEAAAMLGVDVLRYKLFATAWHAGLTALIGGFLAQYVLFVDPASAFNLQTSILTILAVVIGGVGTVFGPIVGVLVMVPISELTRTFLGSAANGIAQVAFGLLAVVLGVWQPEGLMTLIRPRRERRRLPS